MPSFRSSKAQAEHAVSQKIALGQGRHDHRDDGRIHSLGTARGYEQALKGVAAYQQEHKRGDLRALTAELAHQYLHDRATMVSQKTLDLDRQAMQMHLGVKLDVVKSEKETHYSTRSYSTAQVERIASAQSDRNSLATRIIRREIAVTKQYRNNQRIVEIREGDKSDTWELISSPKDPRDMIALKIKGDSIIPATPEEAVVHSFTPTIEFAGALIKINGDFSTDPSRKNIDFDEFSQRSFVNTLTLLIDTIVDILEGNVVRKGFFAPFVNVPNLEGNKFKAKLYKGISEELNSRKLKINSVRVAFSSLRLRPDWLNYEDYEKICAAGFCPVSKEMLNVYPELPLFLELVGVKRLYLNETMSAVNKADISVTGAAQITTKIISQHRFDLTKEKVAEISSLKLFPKSNELVTAKDIESADELKKEFIDFLCNHVEPSDLKQFIFKTEIKSGASLQEIVAAPAAKQDIKQAPSHSEASPSTVIQKPVFRSTPNLQKWRSAEKNALVYLQALNGVLSVIDVSTANMGYDLEVLLENGRRVYIEVKSVNSFDEPIKITNNEYSSAHNFGELYYLAVVINSEQFSIRLIKDPINSLVFQKQIERWSWFCDAYNNALVDANNLTIS